MPSFQIPRSLIKRLKEGSIMQCKPPFPPLGEGEEHPIQFVCKPGEYMGVLFYTRTFSNFAACDVPVKIGETEVMFPCGEAYFKCACAALFKDWDAFAAAFNAATPAACKESTLSITGFDSDRWDNVSYDVMIQVQRWKACSGDIFMVLQAIYDMATAENVPVENVVFYEATSRDSRWGTGVDMDVLKQRLEALDSSTILSLDGIHPGFNLLGIALSVVFREVAGKTLEAYLAESSQDSTLFMPEDE